MQRIDVEVGEGRVVGVGEIEVDGVIKLIGGNSVGDEEVVLDESTNVSGSGWGGASGVSSAKEGDPERDGERVKGG